MEIEPGPCNCHVLGSLDQWYKTVVRVIDEPTTTCPLLVVPSLFVALKLISAVGAREKAVGEPIMGEGFCGSTDKLVFVPGAAVTWAVTDVADTYVVGAGTPLTRTAIPGWKFFPVREIGVVTPATACVGLALVMTGMGYARAKG